MENFNEIEKVTVNSKEVEADIARWEAKEANEKKRRYEVWESNTHTNLTEYLKDKEKNQISNINCEENVNGTKLLPDYSIESSTGHQYVKSQDNLPQREFKGSSKFEGIWLPIEILLLKNLSMTARVILSIIYNLDGPQNFFASDRYMSELLGVSIPTVSRSISKMKKLGLILNLAQAGERRRLKVNKARIGRIKGKLF